MFNKTLLIGAGLMAMVSAAHATDSVDLNVKGTLVNGSCTPTLSGNGVVDFGHTPLGNLSKTDTNQLGGRSSLVLTITCDSAMPLGWTMVDNRNDSVQVLTIKKGKWDGSDVTGAEYEFGLGKTAGGVKIGAYSVYVDKANVLADGVNAKMMYTDGDPTDKTKWVVSGAGEVKSNSSRVYSVEAESSSDGTVLPAKVTTWPIKVAAAIQGTDTLAISDDTNLDGSATISLVYI
ncbi:DUF1120 domain-containing protein [Cronobacter sakazakii]